MTALRPCRLADEGCRRSAQRRRCEGLTPPQLQTLAEQPREAEAEAKAQAVERSDATDLARLG